MTKFQHHQGNGQCERVNMNIIYLLRTLRIDENGKCPLHLPKLLHAYNSTPDCSFAVYVNVRKRAAVTDR